MIELKTIIEQNNLDLMHSFAWQCMQQGANSYKHAMHQFTISTAINNIPEARTVILRKAIVANKLLQFNTDIRSPKVAILNTNNKAQALFYNHADRVQIRLTCAATINYNNEVTEQAWEIARLASKLNYSNSSPSGTLLNEPEQIDINNPNPSKELLAKCKQNFAVIQLQVSKLDMVLLHYTYNKRMIVEYTGAEIKCMNWVQI
jgi:pyridoxamine 5'-phosphate oxidase